MHEFTDKHKAHIKSGSEKGIREIVGVFTDPIIVMPGGWGDTLPQWLKDAITLERLIENVSGFRGEAMTASNAEACAYLYTACLTAPPSHDWAQVYLYVSTKVYEGHRSKDSGVTMPQDIRVIELTSDQQRKLTDLKSWIYNARLKYRKGREHDQRKEEKDRRATEGADDPQLIFDLS